MAGIKDLKLGKDVIGQKDWGTIPEQLGSRPRMLQPGPYRFLMPILAALREAYDSFETEIGGRKVTRVAVVHRDEAALQVTQAPAKYSDRVGTPFATRISNAERKRGKGDDAPMASDMDYVLQVVGAPEKPVTNMQYLEAYEKHAPGKEFGADIEWNWRCDAKKPVRVADPDNEGKTVALDGEQGREKRLGCGSKFYQRDVDKVDADGNPDPQGEYPRTVDCTCGAILFANENLGNFRK